ncbi:MAG: carboxymuconolactone decarboxylase family protein [Rhodospirillaceae bacterium]|nr:carboxymuconolactone decarboxylase family protein [Rhodospirillaceae bacterium]MBT5194438.1 carboxymuconolactone decarboxylase family protein [Rhodospirillaceae bacterium]MBT5895530.1 carboxymuconolactone decarboxylase family protein [Rhodospirillaceae bacterium]MBT6428799.1 carboxymuconolactone decarboxylase family protein [Rhodospirillaceae bacterium]
MPRIPYADANDSSLDPDAAALLPKMQPLNVFKMLAHGGKAFGAYTRLATALLYKGKLDPILREMAIVRAGILCGASYEVFQHERISRDVGMSEDKVQALKVGADDPAFDATEKVVLRLTDEVVKNTKASDETFAAAAAIFDHQELVELIMCIGFYVMTSAFLENFEVEIEPAEVLEGISMTRKGGD